MTSKPGVVRVLMYSHDTFGLGHLTRTLRIAAAIRARHERASILVLTGAPIAPYLPLPPGADIVKLPSVRKSGQDEYQSRDLEVGFARVKKIRRDVIRSSAADFSPHLFLVDNVPLGMKGEIVPTLEFLREKSPSTRIVLNLRDILDDPQVIREAWSRDGVPEALDKFYDRVFVLGDRDLFDAAEAYGLPGDRTMHLGYAAPSPRRPSWPKAPGVAQSGRPEVQILVTAGGGGDGHEFLTRTMTGLAGLARAWADGGFDKRLRMEIVTGPLMDAVERQELARLADRVGAELREFVPDLPQRMSRADLVVAMAGYNTCCEILSHAQAALLYPRVTPRVEQWIRARAFEARGLTASLLPERMHPSAVQETIDRVLTCGPEIAPEKLPAMGGLQRLADELSPICPELESPPLRRPRDPNRASARRASIQAQHRLESEADRGERSNDQQEVGSRIEWWRSLPGNHC